MSGWLCIMCGEDADASDQTRRNRQANVTGERIHFVCADNFFKLSEHERVVTVRAGAIVECWDAGCDGCQDRRDLLREALGKRVHDGLNHPHHRVSRP